MLPYDEVTFKGQVHPFCINCGSDKIVPDDKPFYGGPLFLVAPMKCTNCKYAFSLVWEICPEAMVSH